jgi:predicted small metal-binding protein
MGKAISCKDLGKDCDWVGRAGTEDELMKKLAEHAKTVHGMTEIPPEMMTQVKQVIKDE